MLGLRDEGFGLTQKSRKAQNFSFFPITLVFNSQNARIASLACGLRDECFLLNTNRTNLTNDQRRLNDDEDYARLKLRCSGESACGTVKAPLVRLKLLRSGESCFATVNRRTKRE